MQFRCLCLKDGHIKEATPHYICDSSKGGPAITLKCTICIPPKRAGGAAEATAADAVLCDVPKAHVAMQYRLPGSKKPIDLLVKTDQMCIGVEVDGSSHHKEHMRDRAITATCGYTKLQRDAQWNAHAAQRGLKVLRMPDTSAARCGEVVVSYLNNM